MATPTGGNRPPMSRGPHYWPVSGRFVLTFVLLAVAVVVLEISLASYAYRRLGLDPAAAFALLFACIVGSFFNLPVARLHGSEVTEAVLVRVYGMLYVVPRSLHDHPKIVAVNVGGAVVPSVMSIYLIAHEGLGWDAVIAIAAMTAVVWTVARVVPGVGIVIPTLVPPLAAATVAWIIGSPAVAALAYVGGTLGTLIGADLLNLHRVRDLDAPVVSIGGAGTFDGIFVTGVLAVILAAI
jgi:uncharacterized membrane protein